MSQMAFSSVLAVMAAVLYLWGGFSIVRVLNQPRARAADYLRFVALAAFVAHGAAVGIEMFGGDVIHFGFGMSVSAALFFAMGITIIESYVHRVTGLMGILMLVAAVAAVLPVVFPGQVIAAEEWTVLFRIHLLVALAAYSFMTIAVVQAVFLMKMDKLLKTPAVGNGDSGLLSNMPNLMAMERILFRIIACGFVCFTLVLILGAFATMESHGVAFIFDHKTVLTWLSWIVFAVLLVGRYFFGWRKTKALTWFWVGIAFLVAAYFVYRFVIEVML